MNLQTKIKPFITYSLLVLVVGIIGLGEGYWLLTMDCEGLGCLVAVLFKAYGFFLLCLTIFVLFLIFSSLINRRAEKDARWILKMVVFWAFLAMLGFFPLLQALNSFINSLD